MDKLLGLGVRMWILHTKIQDGVQNGFQKDEFYNFSPTGVKDSHKYTNFMLFYSEVTYKA